MLVVGLLVHRLVVSPFETNCYIVACPPRSLGDESTREAVIIDPGDDPHLISDAVYGSDVTVTGIVNTHGHADHIGANAALKGEFDCPIMVHELDAHLLTDSQANLSASIGFGGIVSPPADRLLKEGDEIAVGSLTLEVIHTPGHTPGGICLLAADVVFSGDTLFMDGIGRTDFPGGSQEQLMESIQTKLLILSEDTTVYPGHGPSTTIARERRENPFL